VRKIRKKQRKQAKIAVAQATTVGPRPYDWSGVPVRFRNNKVYGGKAVDYESSESDKEKHEKCDIFLMKPNENASISLCVRPSKKP